MATQMALSGKTDKLASMELNLKLASAIKKAAQEQVSTLF
jgi:hypothetical protein